LVQLEEDSCESISRSHSNVDCCGPEVDDYHGIILGLDDRR